MRIVVLAWKDICHPDAGGSEVVLHHYVQEMTKLGHDVQMLASSFPGAQKQETIDDVHITRIGSKYTIYFQAWLWYKRLCKTFKPDLIIDQAGGVPLLSPLFLRRIPIVLVVHHIALNERKQYFGNIIGTIGGWVHKKFLQLYHRNYTFTVSDSTKQDLVKLGFDDTRIYMQHSPTDIEPLSQLKKKENYFVFLGRLMPIKRVEHAMQAFALLRKESKFADHKLLIVGGEQSLSYKQALLDLATKLSITGGIERKGFVSLAERNDYLAHAKLCFVPSEKEGYGLIVLEANAMGTPVIAYDVPGLRDSVVDNVNGKLVDDGDITGLAEAAKALTQSQKQYDNLCHSCLEHIRQQPTRKHQTQKLLKHLQTLT